MCTKVGKGRRHDFHLYKTSIHPSIKVLADSEYHGLQKIHTIANYPKRTARRIR